MDKPLICKVPILVFHQVLPWHGSLPPGKRSLIVPLARFRRQMRILKILGFTGITVGQLCSAWHHSTPLPAKTIIITFDDGYAGLYEYAWPTLRQLGFPATCYLIAE